MTPISRLKVRLARWRGLSVLLLSLIVFYAAYFIFLEHKDTEVRHDYEVLRDRDSEAYLAEVASLRGFKVYFSEFARLRHYDTPKVEAPPFLLGRWAVFSEPQRVKENYFPDECLDGVIIEDGEIKTFGKKPQSFKVSYRIVNNEVVATTAKGVTVRLEPIAYTRHVHHLVVNLPGQPKPLYAYLCK